MVHMGTTRPLATPGPGPGAPEEPIDRLTFAIPRRRRLQFNQEAASRDVKKQDLLREIFGFYFAKKAT